MIRKICSQLGSVLSRTFPRPKQLRTVENELDAIISLYEATFQYRSGAKQHRAECIVFSKDRTLQLQALLASYIECVSSPVPVTVLYSCSSDSHQKAYDELVAQFEGCPIQFVRQESPATFREQTLGILNRLESDKVFFLVDDDIFIDRVDITDFANVDPKRRIASLRLGACLRKSYVVSREQPLPPWISDDDEKEVGRLRWQWAQGKFEWGYPISVDGHLFDTNEMRAMASIIPFHSPNSFEANLQVFKRLFLRREGVCYRNPAIVNIPCNKVQSEVPNRSGDVHQDVLLEEWRKGMGLAYKELFGLRPESTHEEVNFRLVKRSEIIPCRARK